LLERDFQQRKRNKKKEDKNNRDKMTRGNQRELARLKNLKKEGGAKQSETEANKGLSLEERKQRDAERMRLKQVAALEKKDQPQPPPK
jgi:hypothetical protein